MNATFVNMLGAVLMSLVVLDCALWCFLPMYRNPARFYYWPIYAVSAFLMAVDGVLRHEPWKIFLYSWACLLVAWMWWHDEDQRRRRRKRLKRLAERVAKVGGRLKVVRPSAPQS